MTMQFYFTQVTTENAKKQDGSMEYKEHQNVGGDAIDITLNSKLDVGGDAIDITLNSKLDVGSDATQIYIKLQVRCGW